LSKGENARNLITPEKIKMLETGSGLKWGDLGVARGTKNGDFANERKIIDASKGRAWI